PIYTPFPYTTLFRSTGEGTLDGQSDKTHWWDWHNDQKPARAKLYQMMQDGTPVEQRVFGPTDKLRPNFIQPHRCKNVLIEGVRIDRKSTRLNSSHLG